jgi:hypothetical protein
MSVLNWVLGGFVLLVAVAAVVDGLLLAAFFLVLGSALFFPPVVAFIEGKIGSPLKGGVRYSVGLGAVFIGLLLLGQGFQESEGERLAAEQIAEQAAFDALPQEVRDSILQDRALQDSIRAAEVALALLEEERAKRRELVEKQFSSLDGNHYNFTAIIKNAMNDPRSFQHVRTTYVDQGESILVTTQFRGTNSFGGVVVNTMTARFSVDGDLIEIVSR